MAEHWAAPGLCEGAAEFLSGCGLPVWLVTNSDTGYVEQAVRQCGIVPAGIVTSEMARCRRALLRPQALPMRWRFCAAGSRRKSSKKECLRADSCWETARRHLFSGQARGAEAGAFSM